MARGCPQMCFCLLLCDPAFPLWNGRGKEVDGAMLRAEITPLYVELERIRMRGRRCYD